MPDRHVNHRAEIVAPRREKVRLLLADGRKATEVAVILGVTERTIERDKRALGLCQKEPWPGLTDEQRARIEAMLDDECPVSEIARTVGIDGQVIRHQFRHRKPYPDPAFLFTLHYRELAIALDLRLQQ